MSSAQLEVIQSRLLDVGSVIATPKGSSEEQLVNKMAFDPLATKKLEVHCPFSIGLTEHVCFQKWIDAMNEELPALTQFILPSGNQGCL